MLKLGYCLALISVAGCATSSSEMPRPNIALVSPPTQTVQLRIANSVPNKFWSNGPNQLYGTSVRDWHEVLKQGFWNGFGGYLRPAPAGSQPDLIVEITRTDSTYYWPDRRAAARLVFAARLLDSTGRPLRVSTGTTESKGAIDYAWEGHRGIVETVELMYEQIAKEFFATPIAPAPAAALP